MRKRISITNVLPVCALLIVTIVFVITSKGQTITTNNLTSVLDQSLTIMIGSMGMVFVLSHGGIDLSIGSVACVAAWMAGRFAMPYGVIPAFALAVVVGSVCGFITSIFVARFKVPSFMVTVAMQTGLRGIANVAVTSGGIVLVTPAMMKFNNLSTKIIVVIVLLVIMSYIFEYTRLGKYSKAIGENELCSKISGINVPRIKTLNFVISGALAGIAGIFMMARTGGINNMVGKGAEMRAIMALLLGSIPVAGGMDSKMFKVVVGALTIAMLENGLSVSGITGGLYQLIEGVMLVFMCVVTNFVKKKSALRDERMMLLIDDRT